MEFFLALENGDFDQLEGRVIVYCRFVPQDRAPDHEQDEQEVSSEQIVAMFFATHPADFVDRFGPPEGGMAELAEREIEAEARRSTDSPRVVPIYAAAIELDLTDIRIALEDVLHAGTFTDLAKCRVMVQLAAHIYFVRYSEQLMTQSGLEAEPEVSDAETEVPRSYAQVPREQMSDFLQKHYISPIMRALEEGNTQEATKMAHDLIRFCGKKGPLTDDAYSLAAAVRLLPKEQGIALLYMYFEKILAITDERFEDAARIRDQIHATRSQTGG